ncbi:MULTISPECIES: DJ-1/PfpI family protein [Clostridium]|uniref:Isonitrile hydratase n=2 Tax=Clostridium TaxID=1485 RepID=D8GUF9_CLOLD|nr:MULTISPECIES: DJ-1/PfpI family protein [Clostridium]ADK14822.1 predicted intracellular protease/amidase related enzyme,ThiJ family [Clostridium ljungdahlii DSM 13528]AGY78068.1 DJ-1/PfpI family protein [Clostridium autoethanogenum DSM 10061]ALU38202.1 putative amidotransferase [Clostridium autoethanogenum DSM 10061]OAA87818.1 Isonitrile hydratase [Clostridium ljungdahlii DSM 13528]OVY50965.1 Isonitrile hydratase [Clostridium autoethanogenum]
MNINIILFNNFETLDIFGPIEILGQIKDYQIHYYSEAGGVITNAQNLKVVTDPISSADESGILVIPGGMGTRELINNTLFLNKLKSIAEKSTYCLSICTGSAVLARCGVLKNKKATSNKQALKWVKSVSDQVNWVKKARWVADGKYYTSSGISAGIDMTLGFISDRFGKDKAIKIANDIEYIWNDDCTNDIFAG